MLFYFRVQENLHRPQKGKGWAARRKPLQLANCPNMSFFNMRYFLYYIFYHFGLKNKTVLLIETVSEWKFFILNVSQKPSHHVQAHAIVKHYNLSKQAANFSLSRSVLSNLTTMLPLLKLFCTFCIEFVIYELAATTVHVPYMAFIKQF